jgi:REP element-mobilizing transposase RayT
MAGTFSQLYIHLVFAVKGRQNLIMREWKEDLYHYIGGVIKANKQKPIIINGMPDHVHIFFGQTPSSCLSTIVREIKSNSSNFINSRHLLPHRFAWQEGYGAFSYSHSHIGYLYKYIVNQEDHHKRSTFREEYVSLLQRFKIDYKQEYLFNWID